MILVQVLHCHHHCNSIKEKKVSLRIIWLHFWHNQHSTAAAYPLELKRRVVAVILRLRKPRQFSIDKRRRKRNDSYSHRSSSSSSLYNTHLLQSPCSNERNINSNSYWGGIFISNHYYLTTSILYKLPVGTTSMSNVCPQTTITCILHIKRQVPLNFCRDYFWGSYTPWIITTVK